MTITHISIESSRTCCPWWVGGAPQGVAESESRRAADAAEARYKECFNPQVAADEKQLMAEHTVSDWHRVWVVCGSGEGGG